MNLNLKKLAWLLFLCWCLLDARSAIAQRDRVYDYEGKNTSGKITAVTAQGVELERSGNKQNLKAGEILKIMFEGDPAGLTLGRERAIDGQYDQAIEELRKIDFKEIERDVITADAVYYMSMCEAKLALAGKGNKDEALKRMLEFASKYRNSWHFFDAAKLLGDLAMGLNDHDKALRYYGSLRKAPADDTRIESDYLTGMVHRKKGDGAAAMAEFDKVILRNAQTTKANRLQSLATAAKAASLASGGKADDGLRLLNSLIKELNPTDLELAARIYNAQGIAHESKGDDEGAILAFLHTHLMFSSLPDAHAEALKHLVKLWPKVGKPEEADKARQELQQRYPGF
jgi:tetratricopeptide (TPR) repeat protein